MHSILRRTTAGYLCGVGSLLALLALPASAQQDQTITLKGGPLLISNYSTTTIKGPVSR